MIFKTPFRIHPKWSQRFLRLNNDKERPVTIFPQLFKMRICIGIVQINAKSIAIRQVNITVSSVSPYSSNTPASKSYEVARSANADASIGTG